MIVAQYVWLFVNPVNQPARIPCPWYFPGKKTGVGSHSLLQGFSCPSDWTWVSCLQADSLPSESLGYPNFKYGIYKCSHSSFCMWLFSFEETLFFLLYNPGTFVKDHLILCVSVYFWGLCSIYLYAYLYGSTILVLIIVALTMFWSQKVWGLQFCSFLSKLFWVFSFICDSTQIFRNYFFQKNAIGILIGIALSL